MGKSKPLVSIITVCWNSAKTIRRTIESVLAQTYSNIEYIIIDGASTDDTMKIIDEYRSRLAVVVSEKDKGISDAFNKGLKYVNGDYIQLINSDDRLDPRKLELSVELLENHPEIGFVFGDIIKENERSEMIRIPGNPNYANAINYTMPKLNHPTVLARKMVYDHIGGFGIKWKLAMDYDWLLRAHKAGIMGMYSASITVTMNAGGLSDEHAYRAFGEVRDISTNFGFNKIGASLYYYMRCIKQFILIGLGIRL